MIIPAKPITAHERANILVEAAIMARENARTCRQMAKQWPSDRREWIERDLDEARKAFKRAYSYLQGARYLRSY